MSKYKEDIIRLRKQGKSYRKIENELGCSRGLISYHCKQEGLDGEKQDPISDEKKSRMKELRETKTIDETAEILDVSRSSVIKYTDNETKDRSGKKQVGITQRQKSGAIAEMRVKAKFTELEYAILTPEVPRPYDIVVEKDGEFNRVQIKSGKLENGAVVAKLTWGSVNSNGRSDYGYSEKDVDFFAIWNNEKEEVHIVPCKKETPKRIHLRIKAAKNGQTKGIRFAEDYKLTEENSP
jgi:DNA-binding CsgD family transcriptional regulator